MSDSKLNDFLASGSAADRMAFTPTPPTPASGPAPGYFWFETDTDDTYSWDAGTASWVKIASATATGNVTTAATLTADQVIIGAGTTAVDVLAAGTDGNVLTMVSGVPAWTATSARAITFVFDGGGSALSSGKVTPPIIIPYACTITAATLTADQTGSAAIDVKAVAYSSYTAASDLASIVASAPPTISSAIKSTDSTLTDWTTAIAANTVIVASLTSSTTCQQLGLVLTVTV